MSLDLVLAGPLEEVKPSNLDDLMTALLVLIFSDLFGQVLMVLAGLEVGEVWDRV